MCTTEDPDLYIVLRALREHGVGKNGAAALEILEGITLVESTSEQATELYDPHKYYNYLIGYNSCLDVLQAAVLSVKLRHLDDYNAARAAIAERYYTELTKDLLRPTVRRSHPVGISLWSALKRKRNYAVSSRHREPAAALFIRYRFTDRRLFTRETV